MKLIALGIFVVLASVGTGTWWASRSALPIMKCDPSLLKEEMTESDVLTICGDPKSTNQTRDAWYPLHGDTRDNAQAKGELMLIYGSVWDEDHHVNLYLHDGRLRSVQIFGDYR